MSFISDAYQTATSKAAQRTILYTLLLATASSVLYAIAAVGYLAFYHEYVPHRVRSTPVHLQYGPAFSQFASAGAPGMAAASAVLHAKTGLLQRLSSYGYHAPHGLADLRSLDLKMDQDYDVSVVLSLPHSPANLAVGNFMVELVMSSASTNARSGPAAAAAAVADITTAVRLPPANPREFLESHGKRVLFAAARPAILAYTDPLVAQAKRLALLPVHLFAPEAASRERLIVPMAESLSFSGPGGPNSVLPAVLYVELRTPGVGGDSAYELQTYGAEVVFSARLRGLRWLMYHHRVFSFLLLTTVSWLVEVAFMAGIFLLLGVVLGGNEGSGGSSIGNSNGHGKNGWETSTTNRDSGRAPSLRAPRSPLVKVKKEEREEKEEREGGGLAGEGRGLSFLLASKEALQASADAGVKEEKQEDDLAVSPLASAPAAPSSSPPSPAVSRPFDKAPTIKAQGKASAAVDDDGSSYSADEYSSDGDEEDDLYEEDSEQPLPLSPSLKKTPQGSSAKKPKDSAVATGRSSSTAADTPLRQRPQSVSRSQPQTPKRETSSIPISSPVSLGKENSARKKAALSQGQKQVRPP